MIYFLTFGLIYFFISYAKDIKNKNSEHWVGRLIVSLLCSPILLVVNFKKLFTKDT